jgi:hypothetical protein
MDQPKIVSDSYTIYCENGWYDTQFEKCTFHWYAFSWSLKTMDYRDRLYYDRRRDS